MLLLQVLKSTQQFGEHRIAAAAADDGGGGGGDDDDDVDVVVVSVNLLTHFHPLSVSAVIHYLTFSIFLVHYE